MKSILISIKPKWVAKILNGKKTIEIRKTMPKCDLPIDVYIYCTKDKKYANLINRGGFLTGMVVAKFTLNKVEEILNYGLARRSEMMMKELLEKSCLTMEELNKYAPHKEYDDNDYIYAIHISDLEIFDKPKELNEFRHITHFRRYGSFRVYIEKQIVPLTKAPQSWCYIESEK